MTVAAQYTMREDDLSRPASSPPTWRAEAGAARMAGMGRPEDAGPARPGDDVRLMIGLGAAGPANPGWARGAGAPAARPSRRRPDRSRCGT